MSRFLGRVLIVAILMSWAMAMSGQTALKQPPGKWWKDRQLIEELKLNAEQQARIESLWMENRKSLIDKKAELDKRNIDLSDILSKETIDESSAVKAFDRSSAARHEVEMTLFLMRVRIKNLLTPEQQQKLEEIADRARNAAKPKPSR